MYERKKILILGAARSGIAAAKLLALKNDVTISDLKELKKEDEELLESLKVKIIITEDQCSLISKNYDLIVKNPAIMATSDVAKKIHELNIPCINEMELAYHYLPEYLTIIGVTGSNGKTTTVTMIYNLLKLHGYKVILGGNIGTPLCDLLSDISSNDILLLEISDHQLYDFHDFKTNISVLTNLCPTHLDYHGTYENYINTKKKIFNNHTNKDIAVINYSNIDSMNLTKDIASSKIYFNNDSNYIKDGFLYLDNKKYVNLDDMLLKGTHNYENLLASLLVVKLFNLDKEKVTDFIKTFRGVEHRIEYVKTIDGVDYYNDSKSTNPTATITALKTFNKPIHLILGGLNRNQDFNELNNYLDNVKIIYSIGEVTEIVSNYAQTKNIPCIKCYNLNTAIQKIKENVECGEIVLLSPGSSSQDQYKKFEDRGDEFKKLI